MNAGRASALGAIEYEAETNFAEAVNTFAKRAAMLGSIDLSGLSQPRIPTEFLQQRLQEGSTHVKGPQSGTFTMRLYMPGHGGATSGAVSASDDETLLGYVIGGLVTGPTGTTVTGGTKSTVETTAANGFVAGSMGRVGTGGLAADGRGNGAFFVVDTHASNDLALLVGLDDDPDAADVVHSAVVMHTIEDANDAGVTPTSIRMRVITGGLQYTLHGCVATAYTIEGNDAGELVTITVTWDCARWEKATSGTYPSAVSMTQSLPAPTGGGGFFCAAVTTSTRDATSKRRIKNFRIEVAAGLSRIMGHDGVSEYQTTIGWVRTPSQITIKWRELADDAATLTPLLDALWESESRHHVLMEPTRTASKALAYYFPSCCAAGERPRPIADGDVWWADIELRALTGDDDTSQLSLSAMRIARA